MKQDKINGASSISRLDFRLWKEYLDVAQSFWLPRSMAGKKRFVGMLILLIAFVASLLFVFVTAVVKGGFYFFPIFAGKIAPGLDHWISSIVGSPLLYLFGAGLIIPGAYFIFHKKQLSPFFKPWIILGVLLLLSFSVSGLNVIISYVGRFFQTALSQKNQLVFWRFLFVYASVFVVGTPLVVIYSYVRQKLGLLWRKSLTSNFIDNYLSNRAYYELTGTGIIDNPDQRISEDLNDFTSTSLSFLLIVLGALIDLIAFTGILWSISRLLSGVLLVYATVGTVITILIGKRLVGLNYNQLRREADFRYGLVHIRDNAESIAFYQGEQEEKDHILTRFKAALKNYNVLIGWQKNLDFFTTGYNYLIVILPTLIAAPMFFAGKIEFGEISQASFAFSQVLGAFSIIVRYFESISAFAAGINRVSSFRDELAKRSVSNNVDKENPDKERIAREQGTIFRLNNMTLKTPDYRRTLIKNISLDLEAGESTLIMGYSGVGKSSLLRALAGLWTSGSGKIEHPSFSEVMFLPQKPYMVLGSFRDQLQYPSGRELSLSEIKEVLAKVNLTGVYQKIKDETDDSGFLNTEIKWEEVLSQGEQQRLAFARLLIAKPKFAILDEATSALDVDNEKQLYDELAKLGICYISVGHRPTLKAYHDQVLNIEGSGEWSLRKA